MQMEIGMPRLLDDLRLLDAAQGYAKLGLYMRSNGELEQMSYETRHWPEVLAVKLEIFYGLELWEMVEIVAVQLLDCARGNAQWITMAEHAWRETRAVRRQGGRRTGEGAMAGAV